MSHRQYLKKFDPLVQFPPAVYCPANGMLNPADPNFATNLLAYPEALATACPANGYILNPDIYRPETIITDTPNPVTDEIVLTATDEGDAYIYIGVTVTGGFSVKIYGNNDALLSTTNYSSGNNGFVLPVGQGKPISGGTAFTLKIAPVIGTNHITGFSLTTASYHDSNGSHIIAAKINSSYLTTFSVSGNKYIKFIEFKCAEDSITTFASVFSNCWLLEKIILPTTMDNCTAMNNMCEYTYALKEITLPASLPKVTTLLQGFQYSGIPTLDLTGTTFPLLQNLSYLIQQANTKVLKLPTLLPEATTFSSLANTCPLLTTLVFSTTVPKVTTINRLCYYSKKLAGSVVIPNMPLCTDAAEAFSQCETINSITFTGDWNALKTIQTLAKNCFKLSTLTLPTSMNGLVNMSNLNYMIEGCCTLVTLNMPTTWSPASWTTGTFIYNAINLLKLETISKVTTAPTGVMSVSLQQCVSLKRFDQPGFKITGQANLMPAAASSTNGIRGKLEYFDFAWNDECTGANLDYNNIPMSELLRMISKFPINNGTIYKSISVQYNPCNAGIVVGSANRAADWTHLYSTNPLTSGWVIGQEAKFAGASFDIPVTFGANIITATGHNYANGRKVAFSNIGSVTAGVSRWTEYYIVNAATDTFQISLTEGGAPITWTGSGSGMMITKALITSIVNARECVLDVKILNNANSAYVQSSIQWYDFMKKGWTIYLIGSV